MTKKMAMGPVPDLDEVVRRMVRSFRVLLGFPDDVDRITQTIDKGLTHLAKVGGDIAQAELIKAKAELLLAEAAWMYAFAEVQRVQEDLAKAEAVRAFAQVAELRERRQSLQQRANLERGKAIVGAAARLRPLLQIHTPEHARAIDGALASAGFLLPTNP